MPIPKDQAIRIAIEHLIGKVNATDICEGWPGPSYGATDEPVWSVRIPGSTSGVGATRHVVISQVTGMVLADELFGE